MKAATSRSVDIECLIFTKIIAVLFTPLLVSGREGFFRKLTDTLAVPERIHQVYLLLTSIRPDRAAEKAVHIEESSIQQGDQVVFEHGLQFGILLLPVAGF